MSKTLQQSQILTNELALKYQKLVFRIAHNFHPKNETELDEYISCGYLGLVNAKRKHNPKRGKLSTFAWYTISSAILNYIQKQNKHNKLHFNALIDKEASTVSDISELFPDDLTPDEIEVVMLRSEGNTYQKIANKLDYSRHKVRLIYNEALYKIQDSYE